MLRKVSRKELADGAGPGSHGAIERERERERERETLCSHVARAVADAGGGRNSHNKALLNGLSLVAAPMQRQPICRPGART